MNIDLEELSQNFDGILLDAYGVFWGGKTGLLPGSKEAMARLVASGKIVGILSNSSQLAQKEIDKLHAHGVFLNEHFHFYMTSGEITKILFAGDTLPFPTESKKFFSSFEKHPRYSSHGELFQGTAYSETENIHEADFIYASIPHINGEDQSNPEVFREKLISFNTHLPMVCANPDRFAYDGNPPRLVVRQGSIAEMYSELGGEVHLIGKPSEKAFAMALDTFKKYNIATSKIVMIGDTPETDIRGANQSGIASVLLTHSGIMADRSVEEINDFPTYYMKRFAYEL